MAQRFRIKEVKDILFTYLFKHYRPEFIEIDPVSVPHLFNKKQDVEISAFLTATISWGNRKTIIKSARYLMQLMENNPYDFVIHHTPADLSKIRKFYYRTFQPDDVEYFIKFLKKIYRKYESLENAFFDEGKICTVEGAIRHFRTIFLRHGPPIRTIKHFPDIDAGSTSKRMCMFLRWMVRKCPKGIDFGIWNAIFPNDLMIPLDVHTHRALTYLGIVQNKTPNWKSVLEATRFFHEFNQDDPCIFDFALFGLGMELKKEVSY
ncbi:MAG: TIGR02757 family protein [Bacteroidia bacterium]|nr:TIGR02757 family protein [Bacteroidia bacterium]